MLNLTPKGRLMCPKRRKNVKQKCISESLYLAAMFFDADWQPALASMFCTTHKKIKNKIPSTTMRQFGVFWKAILRFLV